MVGTICIQSNNYLYLCIKYFIAGRYHQVCVAESRYIIKGVAIVSYIRLMCKIMRTYDQ